MKTTEDGPLPQSTPARSGSPDPVTSSNLVPSVKIKTILVPVDFSRPSMAALDYAVALTKKFGAAIHVVHVSEPDEASQIPGAGHLMRETAVSLAVVGEQLSQTHQAGLSLFWPDNCHVRSGRPYQEICDLAREINADLIVLATRGHTGVKRILLGSTAERVVRFAPCPVLVVRWRLQKAGTDDGEKVSTRELRIRKILVPIDFSQRSMAGAIYAALWAKTFGATLSLFHVFPPAMPVMLDKASANFPGKDAPDLANARLEMEAFAKLDFLRDAKCQTEIRTGSPVDQICGETSRPDVDLTVISTHGRTGLEHVLMGSVAEQVVRYAECPVLVVPSREAATAE
jgi:nucleotide-binding universal stress UspA family protein